MYHADKQKWYQYNDKEGNRFSNEETFVKTFLSSVILYTVSYILVTESKWADVIEAGIGQQQGDQDEKRVPSAYLLVYIDPDKPLFNG